jgi:ribosomal protein S27AE
MGSKKVSSFVRPCCDNCGSPASFIATHEEAGSCFVCEACAKSHRGEYGTRGPRRFFIPEDETRETCGNCGGCVLFPLPKNADPCDCVGRPYPAMTVEGRAVA